MVSGLLNTQMTSVVNKKLKQAWGQQQLKQLKNELIDLFIKIWKPTEKILVFRGSEWEQGNKY